MLEYFAIRPPEGAKFEVDELTVELRRREHVVALPPDTKTFAEPMTGDTYIVCTSAEQAARIRRRLEAGGKADRYAGSVAFLEVTPEYISVYQPAPVEVLRSVESFLLPFLENHPHRVFSEMGEVTAQYQPPELLFRLWGEG